MSLWMVVWMSGQIGGVAGPLPYNMDECQRRANEMNNHVEAQIASGVDVNGDPLSEEAKTLRAECIEADHRPKMTYTPRAKS